MKFRLEQEAAEYRRGTEILLKERDHGLGEDGMTIRVKQSGQGELSVRIHQDLFEITCGEKAHYFRGLMTGLCYLEKDKKAQAREFYSEEQSYFQSNGAMMDCSRNSVLKVGTIKEYIRKLASLGMNTLMLYTEETYEIEGHPYFGAFRGRYSQEELKECDHYAEQFGIEMIPCIQTLAHLHTAFRWSAFSTVRDTEDIILVGCEEAYRLLENMIETVSAPFRSKRIHLGMDEAHGLGLGRYLEKNGYQQKHEIMENHLERINEICQRHALEPMMWSDMFFRMQSPTGDYYDIPADRDMSEAGKPPENMELVYWDYYNHKSGHYQNYFQLHKQLCGKVSFAGGGWIWNGIAPNYSKMEATTNAALSVCKEQGIKRVICTLWQDNGAETPMIAGAPALMLYAEHGFSREVSKKSMEERFRFLWKEDLGAFWLLDKFDHTPGTQEENESMDNPSKYILYQDVMMGMFDAQIKGLNLEEHYWKLYEEITRHTVTDSSRYALFHYYKVLAKLLSHKAELGIKLYNAYQAGNRKVLERISGITLPECIRLAEKLKVCREKLWFMESKPFGYEILDIRLGGVKTRLQSAKGRIDSYLAGETAALPELEENRLLYDEDAKDPKHRLCSCSFWENMISAGNMTGV